MPTHFPHRQGIEAAIFRNARVLFAVIATLVGLVLSFRHATHHSPGISTAATSSSAGSVMLSPHGRICFAISQLRRCTAVAALAPEPFDALGLDGSAHPFQPPSDSAYPGALLYVEVHDAVIDAWVRAVRQYTTSKGARRFGGEGAGGDNSCDWVAALSLVAAAMIDDVTRTTYLLEILPTALKTEVMAKEKAAKSRGRWGGESASPKNVEDIGRVAKAESLAAICREAWMTMGILEDRAAKR